MADIESIVLKGTAEQLQKVLNGEAYTDFNMYQYGINRAGYLTLMNGASVGDEDQINIEPKISKTDHSGNVDHGIVEFSASPYRVPVLLKGIKDGLDDSDAATLGQVRRIVADEAVLYDPQNLSDEQKAQARENIGAMQDGAANSDLDMQGFGIDDVSHMGFSKVIVEDEKGKFVGFKLSAILSGKEIGAQFSGENDSPIRITGIADGVDDNDAATCGQLWDAIGDFPTFEMVENVAEYNEIAKAVEVSTLDELKAYDGTAILKGYRHTYTTAEPDANYNLLKVPVQPGDVIRDKLATWWLPQSSGSSAYWLAYYTAENTKIGKTFSVLFPANASTNCLDIRENGITIPDDCSYVLINVSKVYWYDIEPGEPHNKADNGFTASIITKNADANLTAYDGAAIAPDYVSVGDGSGESYYKAIDDVRIPRYEDALGDIEAILADVVGGVE